MKVNMKRFAVLVICLLFMAGNFAACGQNGKNTSDNSKDPNQSITETSSPAPILKVRYACPYSEPLELAKAEEAINAKLKADGMNLEFKGIFIPMDVWEQKTNIMLSTGEEFELMHIMENQIGTSVFAGRGALTPLNDLLDEYGQDIKKHTEEFQWNCASVDGKIYSIPVNWKPLTTSINNSGNIGSRGDLLQKYGLSVPTTLEEYADTAAKLQKKVKDETGETWYCWRKLDFADIDIWRAFDTFPFYVDEAQIFYVTEQGDVKAWFETDEFKKQAVFMRQMYKNGLLHPDILSVSSDERSKRINDGEFLFCAGDVSTTEIDVKWQKNVGPDLFATIFRLAPEKPSYIRLGAFNSNAVPSTSKHPEAGIQYLNWLHAKKENLNLMAYGIEGEHYTKVSDTTIKTLYKEDGKTAKFQWPFWHMGIMEYRMFESGMSDATIKSMTVPEDNQVPSITLGFAFNSQPVAAEYSNVLSVIKSDFYPIKMGVIDYEQIYPTAVKKLKGAGIDKVIAEYDRQFKAWLESKSK